MHSLVTKEKLTITWRELRLCRYRCYLGVRAKSTNRWKPTRLIFVYNNIMAPALLLRQAEALS